MPLRNQRLPLERFWLTLYPIVAFIYRMFVLAAIALFLAGKFFFIGVLLALAGVAGWVLVPLVKMVAYLCTRSAHSLRAAPRLTGQRAGLR